MWGILSYREERACACGMSTGVCEAPGGSRVSHWTYGRMWLASPYGRGVTTSHQLMLEVSAAVQIGACQLGAHTVVGWCLD
jgi:hypothetical protein